MELNTDGRFRGVNVLLVAAALAVLAGGLVVQIAYAAHGAAGVEGEPRRLLLRLAWLALVMLAFDLVLLFWLAIRLLAGRSRPSLSHPPTEYVDAWAAAGKRIQVEDEPGPDDADDPPEPSPPL